MAKRSIQEEDITIVNIYAANIGAAGKPSLFLEPTGTASFSILVSVSPRGSPVWNWRLLGPAVGL